MTENAYYGYLRGKLLCLKLKGEIATELYLRGETVIFKTKKVKWNWLIIKGESATYLFIFYNSIIGEGEFESWFFS